MLSETLLQAQTNTASTVMSYMEHERLSVSDFVNAEDFYYLINHELPCFKIEVKQGSLRLVVGHYLANIILPSGISLEILPKVSLKEEGESRQDALMQSRQWVAQMLTDIASDKLQQSIDAMTMRSGRSEYDKPITTTDSSQSILEKVGIPSSFVNPCSFDAGSHSHSTPLHTSQDASKAISSVSKNGLDKPWYLGLLNTAEQHLLIASQYLPNRYRTQEQNNPKAQGKLKLKAQLKTNWHRPHYQYTEQSVFQSDSQLKQFLAIGWQQLQALKNTQGNTKSVASIPLSLQGVAQLQPAQYQPVYYQLKRDSSHWRSQGTPYQLQQLTQAIEWCWWLLNSMSDAEHDSTVNANKPMPQPALMINMNHAFERWVLGKLLREIKKTLPDSQLLIQPRFDWLQAQVSSGNDKPHILTVQQLIPDACICDVNGDVTHVIDIKYKKLTRIQEISGSDWQQLATYQNHLNCQNAWLIYPMTKSFGQRLDVCINLDQNRRPIQQDNIQMSVLPFNLIEGKLLIK